MNGSKVRQLRKELGLTGEQLAELSGISQAQISRMETSAKGSSMKSISSVAKALGVGPGDLMERGPDFSEDYASNGQGQVQQSDATANDTDAAIHTTSLKDEMTMIRFLWGRLQSFDPATRKRIINYLASVAEQDRGAEP